MKKTTFVFTLALLILVSCKRNSLDVDISGVETSPVKLLRLDKDLFTLNESQFDATSSFLKQKYGTYYDHYLMNFIARGGSADSAYKSAVLRFINDRDVLGANGYIQKLYPDEILYGTANELNDCIKRFRYHFPTRKLPSRLITCSSGWNYAFAYMDSNLVVALDMYLGDTAMYYGMLRYPHYQLKKMNKHYLLTDIVRGWMLSEFDNKESATNLLSHTIFYGKLFYSVNALLPNIHDTLLIGYTSQQLNYCSAYEKNLWGYFAEKNRLYVSNLSGVRELTSDGPFTGAISKECPPRIAMWVGLQIIRSYMKNNPEVKLSELMQEQDAQKILNKSKYRP